MMIFNRKRKAKKIECAYLCHEGNVRKENQDQIFLCMDNDVVICREEMKISGNGKGHPAGQQLLTMLRSTGGKELDQITADAAAGNMENAGKKLADMLSSQEAKNLLKQLEESL